MKVESAYRLSLMVIIAVFAMLTVMLYLQNGLKTGHPYGNASVIGNPSYTKADLPLSMLSAIPNSTINTILLPGGYILQPYVNYTYSQGPYSSAYAVQVAEAVDLNTLCGADYNISSSCSGANSTLYSLLSEDRNMNVSAIFSTVKSNAGLFYGFVKRNNLSGDEPYSLILKDMNLLDLNTSNVTMILRSLVNLGEVPGAVMNRSDYARYFENSSTIPNNSVIQVIDFIPPFELPFYTSPLAANDTRIVDLVSNLKEFGNPVYKYVLSQLGTNVSAVCLVTQTNSCNVSEMGVLGAKQYAEI